MADLSFDICPHSSKNNGETELNPSNYHTICNVPQTSKTCNPNPLPPPLQLTPSIRVFVYMPD